MPYLQADPMPNLKSGYARVVSAVGLNLRAEPSMEARWIVTRLADGQTLRLAEGVEPVTADGYTWQPVILWVAREYLEE